MLSKVSSGGEKSGAVGFLGVMGEQASLGPAFMLEHRHRAALGRKRRLERRHLGGVPQPQRDLPAAVGATIAFGVHAGVTKLSMTFLVPAFSKAISSLLASMAMIVP